MLIEKEISIKQVPLVGFCTEFKNEEVEIFVKELLKEEELQLNDFIIKQIPNLSLEGDLRKVLVEIKEFKVLEKAEDELNEGKKKIKVSFQLPKGSYATRVIKEMLDIAQPI